MKQFISLGVFLWVLFNSWHADAVSADPPSPSALLIGRWVSVNGDADIEFLADGVAWGGRSINGKKITGTYEIVSDGRLMTAFRLFFMCFCATSTFEFEGTDILILHDENGGTTRYERVNVPYWVRQLESHDEGIRKTAAVALLEHIKRGGGSVSMFDRDTLKSISRITGIAFGEGASSSFVAEH